MEEMGEAIASRIIRITKAALAIIAVCLATVFFFAFAPDAEAATLYLSPSNGSYKVGQTFTVGVYVSSTDMAVNAYSGQLFFPQNIIDVTSVSKNGITSLWVSEPTYSNAEGFVSFEGVVLNPGFTGSGGSIMSITFRTKASGTAPIKFTSSAVLANDGLGTNILSGVGNASFTIGAGETPAPTPTPTPTPAPSGVPAAPKISSSTHPDQGAWYSGNDAVFSWSLPSSVTGVNILANHEPGSDPGTTSDGVFASYNYKDVEDGIWYMHVKLQNDKGWGGTSHYKFSIDSVPPSPLTLELLDGTEATVLEPRVKFSSTDALSGIDHYTVLLNGEEIAVLSTQDLADGSVYTLPPQASGEKVLEVIAFDRAGNAVSTKKTFTVTLPEGVAPPVVKPVIPWATLLVLVAVLLLLATVIYGMVALRHWYLCLPASFRRHQNRSFLFKRLVRTRKVLSKHVVKLEQGINNKHMSPSEKKIGLRISKKLHDVESELGEEIDRLS